MLGIEEGPEKEKKTYKRLKEEIKKKCRKDKEAGNGGQALEAGHAARRNNTRTANKIVNTLANKIKYKGQH